MKHDFTIWRNQILQNPRDISPLKFGMSQDEVIEIFGNPDAVSTMRSDGKPLILKYHDIELHFDMGSPLSNRGTQTGLVYAGDCLADCPLAAAAHSCCRRIRSPAGDGRGYNGSTLNL